VSLGKCILTLTTGRHNPVACGVERSAAPRRRGDDFITIIWLSSREAIASECASPLFMGQEES
jgi:hypothetical protein